MSSSATTNKDQLQFTNDDAASTGPVKKCILCGDTERQKSRYETWGGLERAYLESHLGHSPANNSYICKKHLVEARRYGHDKNHVPAWKERMPPKKQTCFNPNCENKSPERLIKPMFIPNDKLMETLGVNQTTEVNQQLVLCRKCFNETYATIYGSRIPCSSCGATPKSSASFSRHSPDAEVVSQLLAERTGQDVNISPSDYICFACYKTHCSILDSMKSSQADNTLEQAVEMWVNKHNDNSTDKLTKAILKTVIYVANQLLVGKAVLLPWACQVFLDAYDIQHTGSIKSAKVTIETGESTVIFTSRWLLHQLIIYLNSYMSYKCVHMKFGTILYSTGIDILVSLSWALSAVPFSSYTCETYTPTIKHYSDKTTTLHEASYIVNNLIHEEIEKQSAARKNPSCPYPLSFSIDTQLQHTSPQLLDFLNSITASVRERKHLVSGRESNTGKHLKQVRIYYILCLLQLCTNPSQPTMMHDLLADTVEMCGGSRQLLRILNRLGCTSSPDTHDRFVTHHAEAQRTRSIWDELPPAIFTIASVDNFDMLQSYAAVYCGNQQRSYHGTTVQLVQPSHKILICDNYETTTSVSATVIPQAEIPVHEADTPSSHLQSGNPLPRHHAISKRTLQCSPDRSPHKVGKTGPKRKRTVAVKNLTSELKGTTTNTIQMYAQSLTMADFEESSDEQIEQQKVNNKLFSYILLKYANHRHADSSHVLSDIRQFLDNEDIERTQPSQVHYMELINENPDSDDTMCLVAEDLLEKFETTQDGWVVLVGDGKTYQHLQNIKQQYGKAFEKLLIFPGDWHTLKNY